MNVAHGSKYIL